MSQEDISVLNMATDSESWWVRNGYGCRVDAVYTDNRTSQLSTQTAAAAGSYVGTTIVGCIISYEYIEVLHAGLQCVLVVCAFIIHDLMINLICGDVSSAITSG